MSNPSTADWQLPEGVDRNLWAYANDADLAESYDEGLRDCALLNLDQQFVEMHCRPPGRVIDLGCGTGRVLLPLAAAGHQALGVDLSQHMLQIVHAKAQAARLSVQTVRANLVHLEALADSTFDYAVCLFSTLGMVRGKEHRQRAVSQVHRLLRPGGKFLVHVHNRWFNFWDPHGRRWLVGDCLRSLRRLPDAGDRDMPAHDGQGRLTLHLFRRREILRLLRGAGFRILEVRPVSLRTDGRVRWPWWFGWLRAYGYLIAAQK